MAFTTIFITPGLSPAERRRARRSGPRAVATRSDYPRLLRSAGFAEVEELPLTREFEETATAWRAESDANADALAAAQAPGIFEQRQRDARMQLSAVRAGLLQRSLYVARARGGGEHLS